MNPPKPQSSSSAVLDEETPPLCDAFDTLPLAPATLANLRQLGYDLMTPIQRAALPLTLAGHDLLAQAKTGSGKTAVYALTLLAKLKRQYSNVQAMVLCPTRELADQVTQEIRRLARAQANVKVLSLVGGKTIRPQLASLSHGAHVVVGTPGRILDHLQRGSLLLRDLHTLVFDEADRMLDMGFFDDMVHVAQACPKQRQTLFFSATFPEAMVSLSQQFLQQPKEVKLTEGHESDQIRQRFYEVENQERLAAVGRLIAHYRPVSTLAFCNTRQQCRDLLRLLRSQGLQALALHGELEQKERDQVLIQFANRSCSVLVATDVAARGLDIAELEVVINVDIPQEPEVYIHRIGRTGRAAHNGWALSLASPHQMKWMNEMAREMGVNVSWHRLDELDPRGGTPVLPPMITLEILGGRRDKIRPGDVLGALTGEAGCRADQVGKIHVGNLYTHVAVSREIANEAQRRLAAGKLKGRKVKVRSLVKF